MPRAKADPVVPDRASRVADVVAKLNAAGRGRYVVMHGANVQQLAQERLVTGLPGLDYATCGGLVRGQMTCFWGPESSAKTTTAAFIARAAQRAGGAIAVAAVEGFDAGWWRRAGVYIAYTKDELAKMTDAGRDAAATYEAWFKKKKIITASIIAAAASEDTMDATREAVLSNVYDLLVFDSISACSRSREEEAGVDQETRGGNAKLVADFLQKMQYALNQWYGPDGTIEPAGRVAKATKDSPGWKATRNKTVVLLISQARVNMKAHPKAHKLEKLLDMPHGYALRHYCTQILFFQPYSGEDIAAKVVTETGDGKPLELLEPVCRGFRLVTTKSKAGPPGREARFHIHVENAKVEGRVFRKGKYDVGVSLRLIGLLLGVIQRVAKSYVYRDYKWPDRDACSDALEADPKLFGEVSRACLVAAERLGEGTDEAAE